MSQHLAFDLGAGSGRAIIGEFDGKRLSISEIHRFPNNIVAAGNHLYWDIGALYGEIKKALRISAQYDIESIGIDTWGVDFALLGKDGRLLGLPHSYRDPMTKAAIEEFRELMSDEKLYVLTGNQILPINTLFQLFSIVRSGSRAISDASDLLFMPDLFNYLLTGVKATEFTIATTSQLYNPIKGSWEAEIFAVMGLDAGIMQRIITPGTITGKLSPEICEETGIKGISVIAPATHDTGSAVAAIPARGNTWAYISSGTWSLVGVETTGPIINETARRLNFTNEGGICGRFRFLKNVMGLWLLEECRKEMAGTTSYEELNRMAEEAEPFRSLFDPDYTEFLNPDSMTRAIRDFCRRTNQPLPETPGELTRSILESLALKYRYVIEQLGNICQKPIERVHVVGGGSRNRLLNRFTANATGLPVIAGPAEATAIGNLLVQAMALGYLDSPEDIREVVASSFQTEGSEPGKDCGWQEAYQRFLSLVAREECQ